MVSRWQRGLKRAEVTLCTGRTADGSRRRTLQLALLVRPPAVAAEFRGRSVPALAERPCGVRGSAPIAARPALSLVHTYELSRPSRDWCARSTA